MKSTPEELLQDIDAQRSVMVDVSTGVKRIQEVQDEYKKRRTQFVKHSDGLGLRTRIHL